MESLFPIWGGKRDVAAVVPAFGSADKEVDTPLILAARASAVCIGQWTPGKAAGVSWRTASCS
uniref:hypothetical protein n=1 Tax=Clostridium sp. NkU-1 TaxID=1095009 RepID=UPI000AAE500E